MFVPSAVGVHVGVNGKAGFMLEAGGFSEFDFLYNWRSGQASATSSQGPLFYTGTPTVASASGYGGVTFIRGVSDNNYLLGYSSYAGTSIAGDAIANVGFSSQNSVAITPEGGVYIDPESGVPIQTTQWSVSTGVNAFPNLVDFGATGGVSKTTAVMPLSDFLHLAAIYIGAMAPPDGPSQDW